MPFQNIVIKLQLTDALVLNSSHPEVFYQLTKFYSVLCKITLHLFLYFKVPRKTTFKGKHEDSYVKSENDISNGPPILPVEGGYKDIDEITVENIDKFYDMKSMYGMGSGYDLSAPYYYYIYDPRAFYDPDSRYYMGGSYYDLEKSYYAARSQAADTTTDIPEEVQQTTEINEESQTSNEEDHKSNEQDEVRRIDSDTPVAYWLPPDSDFTGPRIEDNPYMMAIPAQVQGFPLFHRYYYQPEYDYEAMIEEEKRREGLEEQGLDANTVENPEEFPRGGRSKRSFSRILNLKSKKEDKAALVKDRRINGNSDSVVFNADCRGGQGNGNGRGGNSGGGTGNGVDEGK